MAKHTRNWKFLNKYEYGVLEFDYLAVLEDSSLGQTKTTKTCAGFMQIEILNQSGPISKFCRRSFNTLEQKSLSFAFHFDLLKSINNLCSCMGFIEQFGISRVNAVRLVFTERSTRKIHLQKHVNVVTLKLQPGFSV